MNIFLTVLITYLSGVIVMALITRYANAQTQNKHDCLSPALSLLSWLSIILYIAFSLEESSKNGFIAKLFNYTDKN